MRNVALEVPLAALALGRRGQRHRAADARVEALRDPFDGSALARRVSSLEDDDQLELLGHDPVLELDELALQTQQLLEVKSARQRIVRFEMFGLRQKIGELIVLEFELDVLVEIVLDLGVDALLELADRTCLSALDCSLCLPWLAPAPRRNERRVAKCSTMAATVLRQARVGIEWARGREREIGFCGAALKAQSARVAKLSTGA